MSKRVKVPTAAEQHAEWLGLLRADGPFLALPVLAQVFPQGTEEFSAEFRARVRQAWAEVSESPELTNPSWQDFVLREVLRFPAGVLDEHAAQTFPGHRPDAVALAPGEQSAARLLLYRRAWDEPLIGAVHGRPPLTEQAAQVCRESGVPLALLTSGRLWVLVHARPGEPTSVASFDADLWSEEPLLLRAFASLCSAPRVLRAATNAAGEWSDSLAALFARSMDEHTHVTTTLGAQVQRAVELFVAELSRLDRESGGRLLAVVSEREVYRGSLTALMRLVFLLFAEEQRLLPVTDPLFAENYAVSTLYDQLGAECNVHGDEIGDRRSAAWPRLLALFNAVHDGCEHPDLRIPAHGGSLFDPAEFSWLQEAAITDRVVREVLDALLMLHHRGRAPERLSYARLGVEQIGHVYEGLLEFSCFRVHEPFVGLRGKNEPELPLTELEAVAARGDEEFFAWLTDKNNCHLTPTQARQALDKQPKPAEQGALHAACDNDAELAARVLPFWGLLRTDLRGQPTVFPADSVVFTQSTQRRSTGTHYTPRALAEEVVEHTLAPLSHDPGPAEGAEPADWKVKPADALLELKVVDPAMGSGAFLVSACRYLADRVVRAWERDGVPASVSNVVNGGEDRDGMLLEARRRVAARCVYGVDRDDMAVELAKLSMWLVTLAKNQPFGFLDHALVCGDSLVGLVREEQLRNFHLDPRAGLEVGSNLFAGLHDEIDSALSQAVELRGEIEGSVVRDVREAAQKQGKLLEARDLTEKLRTVADAIVGAALSTAVPDEDEDDPVDFDTRLIGMSEELTEYLKTSASPVEARLRDAIGEWLRGPRPQQVRPLHWPLEFPEVMRRGGFDAVVGNPPFVGGKRVSGTVGRDVRAYLKTYIADDRPGNADLCSYFLLRNLDVVDRGRVGMIATNTIAQGDSREVGLDHVIGDGWSIYRATKSQPWPGTASLEVSIVWMGHSDHGEVRRLDGRKVQRITSDLNAQSRVSGRAERLQSNSEICFQGCIALGMGFVVSEEYARGAIARQPESRNVLAPYLNGEDLNSQPDLAASRWVIDFNARTEDESRNYPEVFSIVEREVKPERQRVKADGSYVLRKPLPQRWWQYADKRPALREAISRLDRVLAITLVSKTGLPVWVSTGQVFSHKLGIFAVDRPAYLSLLSSNLHTSWAWRHSSTMKSDLNYSPSDVFETFPMPELTGRMDEVGQRLHEFRRSVMLGRELGLTKLYNLVHDPAVTDEDVQRLRELHVEVDYATAEAYGWSDLELGHGFHAVYPSRRWTVAPEAQVELLDRLLELNHERYAEEVRQGLHDKKKSKGKRKAKSTGSSAAQESMDGLFPPENALF